MRSLILNKNETDLLPTCSIKNPLTNAAMKTGVKYFGRVKAGVILIPSRFWFYELEFRPATILPRRGSLMKNAPVNYNLD